MPTHRADPTPPSVSRRASAAGAPSALCAGLPLIRTPAALCNPRYLKCAMAWEAGGSKPARAGCSCRQAGEWGVQDDSLDSLGKRAAGVRSQQACSGNAAPKAVENCSLAHIAGARTLGAPLSSSAQARRVKVNNTARAREAQSNVASTNSTSLQHQSSWRGQRPPRPPRSRRGPCWRRRSMLSRCCCWLPAR